MADCCHRKGLHTYGSLASEYVIEFEKKWMEGRPTAGEAFMGTSDIQSLADLAGGFAVVQRARTFPFDREAIVAATTVIALPLLPLILAMFSIQESTARLVQVLL